MIKRKRVQVMFNDPSLTKQSFKESVDINKIMEKYKKTGILPMYNKTGVYADLTEITDYRDSLHKIMRAEEAFENLPAVVRNRFQNDPGALIEFLSDKKNKDEAIKLGLIDAPKEDLKAKDDSIPKDAPKA